MSGRSSALVSLQRGSSNREVGLPAQAGLGQRRGIPGRHDQSIGGRHDARPDGVFLLEHHRIPWQSGTKCSDPRCWGCRSDHDDESAAVGTAGRRPSQLAARSSGQHVGAGGCRDEEGRHRSGEPARQTGLHRRRTARGKGCCHLLDVAADRQALLGAGHDQVEEIEGSTRPAELDEARAVARLGAHPAGHRNGAGTTGDDDIGPGCRQPVRANAVQAAQGGAQKCVRQARQGPEGQALHLDLAAQGPGQTFRTGIDPRLARRQHPDPRLSGGGTARVSKPWCASVPVASGKPVSSRQLTPG